MRLFIVLLISYFLFSVSCVFASEFMQPNEAYPQLADSRLSDPELSQLKEKINQDIPSPDNKVPAEQSDFDKKLDYQAKKEKDAKPGLEIPEWVRRTNIAISAGTDEKPRYFMETIQPFFGSDKKNWTFFNQSRVTGKEDRPVFNTGLGLRKVFRESYLLGINAFYDYQDLHKHSRAGVGFEATTKKGIEARVNGYIRVSNERLIKEENGNEYYEKVANGFDYELGAPIPFIPSLRAYMGGYWYDFEHFKNKYGWKGRLEYSPVKYSRLNFEVYNDSKIDKVGFRFEGAMTLAFTSFAMRDIISDFRGPKEAYPDVNLHDKVLDRVVRDFNITVISSIKSKATGLTIEGGKKSGAG